MIKYSGIYESSTPPTSTKALWVDGGVLKIYKNGSWRPVDDPKSKLTIDSSVKEGSTNPVSGGAVHTALMEKADSSKVEAVKDHLEALATKTDKIGTLRDLYISAGVVYNEATGYYELNGLTDITEEEMRKIYLLYITNYSQSQHLVFWLIYPNDVRTNIPPKMVYVPNIRNSIGDNAVLEVLVISDYALFIESSVATANGSFPKLRRVVGDWVYAINNPSKYNFSNGQPFQNCPLLEEIRMKGINKSHTFAVSPNLSKESVQCMITNANPPSGAAVGSIAITLHPTAYARLKDDADIVAALEAKGGIVTLVSA